MQWGAQLSWIKVRVGWFFVRVFLQGLHDKSIRIFPEKSLGKFFSEGFDDFLLEQSE
jgi:hypothetical protein